MPITPKLPLNLSETELYESTEDIVQVTRFHIKNIVLTNPGEKISDPEFGVGIRRYLFENITQGLLNNLEDVITDQIQTFM